MSVKPDFNRSFFNPKFRAHPHRNRSVEVIHVQNNWNTNELDAKQAWKKTPFRPDIWCIGLETKSGRTLALT